MLFSTALNAGRQSSRDFSLALSMIIFIGLFADCRYARAQCQPSAALLPIGVWSSPTGTPIPVGKIPLNTITATEGHYIFLSLNGWNQQGVQVVHIVSRRVIQTLPLPAAFLVWDPALLVRIPIIGTAISTDWFATAWIFRGV